MKEDGSINAVPAILGPALSKAIAQKGFTSLTPVQLAVLDPQAAGRDLRITSQTGSGKTLAIGFVLRDVPGITGELQKDRIARPHALIVAPTRELARQVETELSWLYASLGVKLAAVTGGASYREEHRALAAGPGIVVGTPGRLLDHLERGSIDASQVAVVVLDEADRMLDLGFREALESILGRVPDEHTTHLVSATFPPDVRRLADSVQTDPVHIEGTRLGAANVDIDHVLVLIEPRERLAAIINLLLADPEARTIVFARTRADVGHVMGSLAEAGFAVGSLSGEMEQQERTRALAAFKRGTMRILVATDVAARGIDVQEVSFVIHAEPPTDPDSYTHRSGRTGRAGRKGTSAVLVTPREMNGARRVLERAGVGFRYEAVPAAEQIRLAQDERLIAALARESTANEEPIPARTMALARKLVAAGPVERTIARLLSRGPQVREPEPRDVRRLEPPPPVKARPPGPVRVLREPIELRSVRETESERPRPREMPRPREPYTAPAPTAAKPAAVDVAQRLPRARTAAAAPVPRARAEVVAPPARVAAPPPRKSVAVATSDPSSRRWASFTVNWGEIHGADARRLLAMVCRRGNIESRDVGGIRIARSSTVIEIAEVVSRDFATAVKHPDPRDPNVTIKQVKPKEKSDAAKAKTEALKAKKRA